MIFVHTRRIVYLSSFVKRRLIDFDPRTVPLDAVKKKLAALGYDQTRFTAHIDFKMRDFVRAEQKKYGLVTDGQPNAALMEKMGLKPTAVR